MGVETQIEREWRGCEKQGKVGCSGLLLERGDRLTNRKRIERL
jgi:hypothetical protein